MLIQCLLFVIISCGGVFGAAYFRRRYEELLPVTCASIVMLLFVFGILGALYDGVLFVLIVCVIAYISSIIRVIYKREFSSFLKCLFTPAFFVFVLVFVVLSYLNNGKLADSWDEFSHWMIVVKEMARLDDFGTNPQAALKFAEYPPATALFQYFFQKITFIFSQKAQFCEWRVNFAGQIFFLSFLFPFFKGFRWKRPQIAFISVISVAVAPILFYSYAYTNLHIEQFIGVVSGAGLAYVFTKENKDLLYYIYVFLTIATLVLSKYSGLFFAVFLFIVFIEAEFFSKDQIYRRNKKDTIHSVILSACALASLIIPKVLWTLNIRLNNVKESFPMKIDFPVLFKIIFGKDDSYRVQTCKNFWNALFTDTYKFGCIKIPVPYFVLLIFVLSVLILTYFINKKYNPSEKSRRKAIIITACIQPITYIIGLCVIYMFQFSEYEALRLASFERYINVVFMSAWVFSVLVIIDLLQIINVKYNIITAVFLCVVIITTPWFDALPFLRRSTVYSSIKKREPYVALSDTVNKYTENNPARVYVISQESNGFDYWVLRFNIRPCNTNNGFSWSLGKPFYDGDIWTKEISASDWQNELTENFDYVIIYHLNHYFINNYGELFANPNDIHENGMYRINTESRLLELCP